MEINEKVCGFERMRRHFTDLINLINTKVGEKQQAECLKMLNLLELKEKNPLKK